MLKANRQLEQELDDYDRKYRNLLDSYQTTEEMLELETEKTAMLQTEVLEKCNLQELVQRITDENKDLKSEIKVKEKHGTFDVPMVSITHTNADTERKRNLLKFI